MKLNHYNAYMKVAVNECADGRIAGVVYSHRLKEPIHFNDTTNLLLQIEAVLDEQDFPRAFQRKRTFGSDERRPTRSNLSEEDESEYISEEEVQRVKGEYATFAINVITRQNTSWQGYLDWLDGSPRKAYNSVLELLKMISEGLRVIG